MKMTFFELFYLACQSDERFISDFRWKDVETFCTEQGLDIPAPNHLKPFRVERGVYSFTKHNHGVDLESISNVVLMSKTTEPKIEDSASTDLVNFVPFKKPTYVPFGVADDIRTIIATNRYVSVYVTGDTGYGKTMIVVQECAFLGREVIRVNCTPFTTEDELIGHYVLIEGTMVWKDGPVLFAMKRGAILLLDEVDALDPKRGAFCLFPLLEGEGVFVKKLNQHFMPKEGFNVIVTANTKGKGDTRGRHAGTNVQNEAFLDRFKVTLEHTAPDAPTEKKILNMVDESNDSDFVTKIIAWCNTIRKTYDDDGCDEVISTRRACDIMTLYSIFNDREKVIKMVTNKFDAETSASFVDLYSKIDDTPNATARPVSASANPVEDYPF